MNMSANCFWSDFFDEDSKETLECGSVGIGLLSAVCSFSLLATIFFSNLRSDLSYRNLAFFPLASFIRCAASVIFCLSFMKTYNVNELDNSELSCNYFGFWASFVSVYEVEGLTHICIERYVVAKYITNGWEIQKCHYILYQFLCVMFALMYSLPPLFGLGKYSLDFSCQNCVLDMVLPGTWDRYVVIIIYLLRSVKSTGFMIIMLLWARQREARYNTKNLVKLSQFTKNVIMITIVNLTCWFPMAVLRSWVVLSFFIFNHLESVPSLCLIQGAMWIYSLSPALTSIVMFIIDDTLLHKMKSMFYVDKEIKDNKKE